MLFLKTQVFSGDIPVFATSISLVNGGKADNIQQPG